MNKTKKGKLKKIAVFCAAVMLALVSVFATLETQKEEIRASAEEGTEETSEEETIYPTDNLFDINNAEKVSGHPSFSRNENQITVFYSLVSTYKSANVLLDTSLVGKTISLTALAMTDGINNTYIRIQWVSDIGLAGGEEIHSNIITGNSFQKLTLTGVVPESPGGGFNNLCIMFYLNVTSSLETGVVYSSTFKDIMLNLGEVAYPYRPCNKHFYDKGYTQGKADGKEEGYTEGYQDASDTLNLGVLKGSKISASLTYSDNTKATITNEDPTFTYNGIDFRPSRDKWEASKMLEDSLVTVNFANSFSYKAFPLRFQGSSDVMSGTFLSTDGKKYSFNIERTDLPEGVVPGQFVISGSYPDNLQIKSVTIQFGRATDTLEGVLLSVSGQYQNGYANGYNDGFADNDSYSKGYVAGRDFGYNNGYNAGLAEGSAENGFAGLLFAVIDTPVKAFSSLLNFEILGVNMKSFVLSVLTLALFVVVVRWLLGKA